MARIDGAGTTPTDGASAAAPASAAAQPSKRSAGGPAGDARSPLPPPGPPGPPPPALPEDILVHVAKHLTPPELGRMDAAARGLQPAARAAAAQHGAAGLTAAIAGSRSGAALLQVLRAPLWQPALPRLEAFHLGDVALDAATLTAVVKVLRAGPALRSVRLDGCAVGPAGAAALATLSQIAALSLRDNALGDHGVAALAPLRQVRQLQLRNVGLTDAAVLARLGCLRRLQALELTNNDLVELPEALLTGAPALVALSLGQTYVDLDTLWPRLAALGSLRRLELSMMGELSPEGLASLRQVTHLELSGCTLTTAALRALGGLPALVLLDVSEAFVPVADVTPLVAAARPLPTLLQRSLQVDPEVP